MLPLPGTLLQKKKEGKKIHLGVFLWMILHGQREQTPRYQAFLLFLILVNKRRCTWILHKDKRWEKKKKKKRNEKPLEDSHMRHHCRQSWFVQLKLKRLAAWSAAITPVCISYRTARYFPCYWYFPTATQSHKWRTKNESIKVLSKTFSHIGVIYCEGKSRRLM